MKTSTLVALAILLIPMSARAAGATGDPCASDSDCQKGLICLAVPCAACLPETECPACPSVCGAGSGTGTGTTSDCATDADCPTGFACETQTVSDCGPSTCACACPACAPEAECPACVCPPCEQPEACTPQTASQCVYKPATCAADTDCADGFHCQEMQTCTGGGCVSAGCACAACLPETDCPPCDCPDVVYACPDVPATCTSNGAYCTPRDIACTGDSDCPANFECVEQGTECACPMIACIADGPDGGCPACDCPPSTYACMPTGWAGHGITSPDQAAAMADAEATGGTTSPGADAGVTFGTDAAAGGTGETATGLPVPTSASTDVPAGSATTDTAGGASAATTPGTSTPAAKSCTAGALPADASALSLLALAASLFLRRRRGQMESETNP